MPAEPPISGVPDCRSCRPVLPGKIRHRRDFLAANAGVRVPMPGFVLLVKPASQSAPLPILRVGFTVSRKVGNAVVRNRARRRLRELARMLLPAHGIPGADHVFIARSRDPEAPFGQLRAEVEQALGKAKQRLGKATAGKAGMSFP